MADAVMTRARREQLLLTVLYDERRPLCRRLERWLAHHRRTTRVLTVVCSDGVYERERAWLVCGWALPDWQPLTDVAARVDVYRHRLPAAAPVCSTCPGARA